MHVYLDLDEAASVAGRFLRRTVRPLTVLAWREDGLALAPDADVGPLVRADHLEAYLARIAPRERLMTSAETIHRLRTKYRVVIGDRNLRFWVTDGVVGPDGVRDVLPTTTCPWFQPKRRLIHPGDLDAFMRRHRGLGAGRGRQPHRGLGAGRGRQPHRRGAASKRGGSG